MSLPDVAVLIPTYNRRQVLTRGINLLQANLRYEGRLKILVGDDSDNPDLAFYHSDLDFGIGVEVVAHVPRKGLGANLNWLLQNCGCDFVIQQDDDHWLLRELDITPHVRKLLEDPQAGCVRLMGVAGHKYRATLEGMYWRIDWESPELYIASNRPHLKVISRFHGDFGFYPENLKLGQTEEHFCHICIDRARLMGEAALKVLIPLDVATESSWDHVGHSWQMEGF